MTVHCSSAKWLENVSYEYIFHGFKSHPREFKAGSNLIENVGDENPFLFLSFKLRQMDRLIPARKAMGAVDLFFPSSEKWIQTVIGLQLRDSDGRSKGRSPSLPFVLQLSHKGEYW